MWLGERDLPSFAILVLSACGDGEGLGLFVIAGNHDDPVAGVHENPSHRPKEAHEVLLEFVSADLHLLLVLTQVFVRHTVQFQD